MKKLGFNDEILNFCKLSLYDWNLSEASYYYNKDNFCHWYCLDEESHIGCWTREKTGQKCRFQHLSSFSLSKLINVEADCDTSKLICLYLLYLGKYCYYPILWYRCAESYLLSGTMTGNEKDMEKSFTLHLVAPQTQKIKLKMKQNNQHQPWHELHLNELDKWLSNQGIMFDKNGIVNKKWISVAKGPMINPAVKKGCMAQFENAVKNNVVDENVYVVEKQVTTKVVTTQFKRHGRKQVCI